MVATAPAEAAHAGTAATVSAAADDRPSAARPHLDEIIIVIAFRSLHCSGGFLP
jgi:hypothetical protein